MNQQEIHSIVTTQRRFFFSGKTQSVDTRIAALKNLQCAIQKYEPEINAALRRDLGKSPFESYMCEVGLTLSEISYMLRHISSMMLSVNKKHSFECFLLTCLILQPLDHFFQFRHL